MAQVTLQYRAHAGILSPAAFAALVGDVDIFDGELELFGLVVVSDTTVVEGRDAVRTIVLETNALGDSIWLTAESLIIATRNLYTASLELRVPAKFTAAEPVVTGLPVATACPEVAC